MYLYPKTILKGNFLGRIDIAVRKPDVDEKPIESHILYIEDGEAFYATSVSPQNSSGRFKTEFSIGDASLVAIEFDAEWQRNAEGKYRPITLNEPWLLRVKGNELLAQKGETFTPLLLDTGNITSLKAVRGWQNRITPEDDHGIVVFYVKDGLPYYVNYSQQPLGYKDWGTPYLIPGFTNVTRVSGFRSNDYRLIVLVEQDGLIHQVVSARNWAGIGIPGERVSAGLTGVSVTLTELDYVAVNTQQSRLAFNLAPVVDFGSKDTYNDFYALANPDAFTITARLEQPIFNLDIVSFRIKDSTNRAFRIDSIAYNKLTLELTLSMEDFNNAYGAVTLSYDAVGTSKNILGNYYLPFSTAFTPQGLVPVDIPLPVVVSITNTEG